jgi:hypothetical protein
MDIPQATEKSGVRLFSRRGFETAPEWRNSVLQTSTYFVSLTTIPVILVITIRMLLSKSVLVPAIFAVIFAFAVAATLSYLRLLGTPARIAILGDAASVDDAWSRFRPSAGKQSRKWFHVLDVRGSSDSFEATIGLESYRFDRADWSEYDELRTALFRLTPGFGKGGSEE